MNMELRMFANILASTDSGFGTHLQILFKIQNETIRNPGWGFYRIGNQNCSLHVYWYT